MDIKVGDVKPLFAHDVIISTVFRVKNNPQNNKQNNQDNKKSKIKNSKLKNSNSKQKKIAKIEKEAHSELLFLDMATRQVISRVALPFSVLESLPRVIEENIKKTKKELEKNELPKEHTIETLSQNKNYLG